MTADELIDSYVADVVTLLPRRQRRDVAQELRVLLREEADAAAGGGDHLLRPRHARAGRPGLADQDALRRPGRAGGVRGIRL